MDESLKKNCPFVFGEIKREALSTMPELTDKQLYQVYRLSVKAGENGTVSPVMNEFVKSGSAYTFTATPNEGYTFSSWSDGNTTNPRTVTVNANTEFKATFIVTPAPTTYTVSLTSSDVNKGKVKIGEGESGATASQSGISSGTQVSISAVPETGFVFEKWSDEDTNATRTLTVAANVSLTANFVAQVPTYSVTLISEHPDYGKVKINDGTPGVSVTTSGISAGTQVTLTAVPDPGCVLVSWSDEESNVNPRTITVNSDITLSANMLQSV